MSRVAPKARPRLFQATLAAVQRERLAAESAEVERALWFVEPAARVLRVISSRPVIVALGA